MEKTKIFIFILLIGVGVAIAVFFGLQLYKPKIKTYSNVTELYSLFTPYMKSTVNYRLQAINCQPNEYYYENSSVCFVCNDMHACFGYGWVIRAGGEKMNPKGVPYLSGKYNRDALINFYSWGLAKELGCSCEMGCECSEGIKVRLEDNIVIFSFPENYNITKRIEEVARDIGFGNCEFIISNISSFNCGVFGGGIISNKVII